MYNKKLVTEQSNTRFLVFQNWFIFIFFSEPPGFMTFSTINTAEFIYISHFIYIFSIYIIILYISLLSPIYILSWNWDIL